MRPIRLVSEFVNFFSQTSLSSIVGEGRSGDYYWVNFVRTLRIPTCQLLTRKETKPGRISSRKLCECNSLYPNTRALCDSRQTVKEQSRGIGGVLSVTRVVGPTRIYPIIMEMSRNELHSAGSFKRKTNIKKKRSLLYLRRPVLAACSFS